MQEKLQKNFSRFFFHTPEQTGGMGFLFGGFGMFGRSGSRSTLSEIIKDSVYLSNFPSSPLASITVPKEDHSALVVSCVDLKEMMASDFLLEPDSRFKYHIVPMLDITAEPGCIEYVIDSILMMSEFSDLGKKIHIHCYQGVGRSAMMTAIFLSYRYMCGDETVMNCFNPLLKEQLNSDDRDYVKKLYRVACDYVFSKRSACQFDSQDRFNLAIEVLNQLKQNPEQKRDENYSFLAQLVQSKVFKKFVYSYFMGFHRELETNKVLQQKIREFFSSLSINQDGWYTLLKQVCQEECSDTHPLAFFGKNKEYRDLFNDLLKLIEELSSAFPNAEYSKHIREHQVTISPDESYSVATFNPCY